MIDLLNLVNVGITVLVPAIVWTVLLVGLFQLIWEPIRNARMTSQRVAPQVRSR